MTGCINRARELVDRQNARIGIRHAGAGFVEGDMTVNADAAVADFDSAGVFDHFRKILENLRTREDNLLLRHQKIWTDMVEKQIADLSAEAQRMCFRNELIVVIAVLVHEEEADIFQTQIQIIDFRRHDPVRLRRSHRHDEGDNPIPRRRFLELFDHLISKILIQLFQGFRHFEMTFCLPDHLIHGKREEFSDFFRTIHFHFSLFIFLLRNTLLLFLLYRVKLCSGILFLMQS